MGSSSLNRTDSLSGTRRLRTGGSLNKGAGQCTPHYAHTTLKQSATKRTKEVKKPSWMPWKRAVHLGFLQADNNGTMQLNEEERPAERPSPIGHDFCNPFPRTKVGAVAGMVA